MKNNTNAQQDAATSTITVPSFTFSFTANKGDTTVGFDSHELDWSNQKLVHQLIQFGCYVAVHHRGKMQKGTFGAKEFSEALIETFKLDPRIKNEAEDMLAHIEKGNITWEDLEKGIKSKYGWELESRDFDGLYTHFQKKPPVDPIVNI